MIPIDDSFALLSNILALAEYAYRLGVKHGAYNKDPVAVKHVAKEVYEKKFRLLMDAPSTPISVNSFCDRVIVWCGLIYASHLRDFLRASVYASYLKVDILLMTHLYYRRGLIDGLEVDKLTADEFLGQIGRGSIHKNIVTGKKQSKRMFFDEYKYNINLLDERWRDNGTPTCLNRLSIFMGRTWAKRE